MIVLGCSSMTLMVDIKSLLTFKRDRNVTVEQMSESASLRPILAMVAWKMFQDRPLTGCGTGQYLEHAKNYLFDRSTNLPLEKVRPYVQHNMFLATLVENGLVTLIPFCFLIFCWTLWSWRLWNARQLEIEYRQLGLVSLSLLIAYIVNGLFHDVLIFPMINAYMFFIAGTVRNCAVHLLKQRQGSPIRRETESRPPANNNYASQLACRRKSTAVAECVKHFEGYVYPQAGCLCYLNPRKP